MIKLTAAQKNLFNKIEATNGEYFVGRFRDDNMAQVLAAAGLIVKTRASHWKKV